MGEVIQLRSRQPLEQRLLSLPELMEVLGGSRSWWNGMIREGLPRRKWGKRFYRYDVSEVQAWLDGAA